MVFTAKMSLKGSVVLVTGLHIGGSHDDIHIGGIDNGVIKNANQIPFIPGSSLKGKMRFCLENSRTEERSSKPSSEPCNCGTCTICKLFGSHSQNHATISRLLFRDSPLDMALFQKEFPTLYSEFTFTEEKTENVIDRIAGKSLNLRKTERVLAGSQFYFNVLLDIYKEDNIRDHIQTLLKGLRLLEDTYLGGSGTRGYGCVQFKNLSFELKKLEDYAHDNQWKQIYTSEDTDFPFSELLQKIQAQLQ